eukprot:scaffold7339_cov249-Pinguiococcus_pyrenoidosus.AAC.30
MSYSQGRGERRRVRQRRRRRSKHAPSSSRASRSGKACLRRNAGGSGRLVRCGGATQRVGVLQVAHATSQGSTSLTPGMLQQAMCIHEPVAIQLSLVAVQRVVCQRAIGRQRRRRQARRRCSLVHLLLRSLEHLQGTRIARVHPQAQLRQKVDGSARVLQHKLFAELQLRSFSTQEVHHRSHEQPILAMRMPADERQDLRQVRMVHQQGEVPLHHFPQHGQVVLVREGVELRERAVRPEEPSPDRADDVVVSEVTHHLRGEIIAQGHGRRRHAILADVEVPLLQIRDEEVQSFSIQASPQLPRVALLHPRVQRRRELRHAVHVQQELLDHDLLPRFRDEAHPALPAVPAIPHALLHALRQQEALILRLAQLRHGQPISRALDGDAHVHGGVREKAKNRQLQRHAVHVGRLVGHAALSFLFRVLRLRDRLDRRVERHRHAATAIVRARSVS